MRVIQRVRQSVGRRKFAKLLRPCVMDALESRRLFSGGEEVQNLISPILANLSSPSNDSVTLNQHFFDSTLPGTLATFTTSLGTIQVGLTDAATPETVANFLTYVNNPSPDNYTNTFFHRSVDLTNDNGGSPSDPGTIIQGGGYAIMNGSIGHIDTGNPVNDEYQTELYKDVAGTLAMAKTSMANSATSEWYFNVTDNTELDTPTTDSNGVATSYTVFGTVLSGMNVIDQIAALPTYNLGGGLTTVPITGLTEAQLAAGASINANNLVFTDSITTEPGTSYTVSSDNKALVTPTVTNGVLSFTYGAGLSGTADITVNATNLDGTSASTVFPVTVPNPATPTAGPVANTVTPPYVVTGTSQTFSVLKNDTDSVAALTPSSVTIVVPPTHGTASVNTSTGFITYTPAAGYIGADQLSYTVGDTNGATSTAGTVNLDAVPTAVSVNIGTDAAAKSMTFIEPDGVVGHLTVHSGTAAVTFTSFQVTTTTKNGVLTASGAGTTITSITITNNPNRYSSLVVQSNGPVTLGSVNNSQIMFSVIAPNGTLSGTSDLFHVQTLSVAAAVNATLNLGNQPYPTTILIPSVTNTSVTCLDIATIKSKQWLNTDGGNYNLSANYISALIVPGTFAENLSLTSTGYDMVLAKVGQPTGGWDLSGSLVSATLGTPGSSWQMNSGGLVRTLNFKGNLANQVTAAAITTLTVAGTTSGAVIETDATFSKTYDQIQHLTFRGAVSNTVVFSAGNVGSISAPSFTGSRVYAGVDLAVAQSGIMAANASNLSNDAKIAVFTVGRGANAFSNSLISADVIGSLQLGKINTSNGGTAEGVSAHTIGAIAGTLVPGGVLRPTRADLKSAAALAAYETKEKLALGDFQINLF